MAFLTMILRKMVKNKWLEMSLFLGLVFSVGLISSIPIYTDAILHRMMIKQLQQQQQSTDTYPGSIFMSGFMNDNKTPNPKMTIQNLDRYIQQQVIPDFGLPVQQLIKERMTDKVFLDPVHPDRVDTSKRRYAYLESMTGLGRHIKLVDGHMPADHKVNGVYETLIQEKALIDLNLTINQEFKVTNPDTKKTFIVKPVGVFEADPSKNPIYWYYKPDTYSTSLFFNDKLFAKDFVNGSAYPIHLVNYVLSLDYNKLRLHDINRFLGTYYATTSHLFQTFGMSDYEIDSVAVPSIRQYIEKAKQLRMLMWSLDVPVIIMLAFYLYMVSNLIIERQTTEIAVLRSRGASKLQIILMYIVESLILGSAALAAGPYVGLFFTKVLGSSNGFLAFVQRTGMTAGVNLEAYRYALYAVLVSMLMTLIPAVLATRNSIVSQKQKLARKGSTSFWHKFGLDIILVAVSFYGLYTFHQRMTNLVKLGANGKGLEVDPLLFLIPALFMLGFGLLLLRIYPWLIKLIHWAGKRWWSPSAYSTLIQVGRSVTQYQFLMVFLILTVSTGIFSASAARTLNQNQDDRIHYMDGADIVINTKWENDAPPPGGPPGGMPSGPKKSNTDLLAQPQMIHYAEPPFEPYRKLPGVAHAAKVFVKDNVDVSSGQSSAVTRLMGIDTDDFGYTSWFRQGLLDHSFYDYLNLIAKNPFAVLVSRETASELNLRPGDSIQLSWGNLAPRTFTVYGIVDYFPGFNPLKSDDSSDSSNTSGQKPMLVVAHLDTVQHYLALEPYQVWLKLKPDADRQALYKALGKMNTTITSMTDSVQEVADAKRDPFRMGMNGVMTLGFVISLLISFCGFLIYWVLSLQGRILQYGIIRAIGLSFRHLLGMLVGEQFLTSLASVVIGAFTGMAAGKLFVPLFKLSFDPTTQVPPFRIVFLAADWIRMFSIILIMIVVGFLLLGGMLSRIKIHQAVKLGED